MGLFNKIIKSVSKPYINNDNGKLGESKVNKELNFNDVNTEHRQINNLIIVDESGNSHQIDHIVIRKNGIFCIETKKYSGKIYERKNQDKWVQYLNNGVKYSFYNPLKQNNSHAHYLSYALDRKYKINSIVVMVNNNADNIECENVINLKDLNIYLNEYNDGINYTIEQINEIYEKLEDINNNQISNREHINNIHKMKSDIKQRICPRCNGNLVERSGKYGLFYGCSNYPKCKFTMKK